MLDLNDLIGCDFDGFWETIRLLNICFKVLRWLYCFVRFVLPVIRKAWNKAVFLARKKASEFISPAGNRLLVVIVFGFQERDASPAFPAIGFPWFAIRKTHVPARKSKEIWLGLGAGNLFQLALFLDENEQPHRIGWPDGMIGCMSGCSAWILWNVKGGRQMLANLVLIWLFLAFSDWLLPRLRPGRRMKVKAWLFPKRKGRR